MTDYLQIKSQKIGTLRDTSSIFVVSTANTSAVYPPLSITPRSSSSKVLYLMTQPLGLSSATATGIGVNLQRNGSNVSVGDTASSRISVQTGRMGVANAINATMPFNLFYVDSPATTSNITYNLAYTSFTATTGLNLGYYAASAPSADVLTYGSGSQIAPRHGILIELNTTNGGSIKTVGSTSVTAASSGSGHGATTFDPSLSVTITPTSASSTLWVIGYVTYGLDRTADQHGSFILQRDGSAVFSPSSPGSKISITGTSNTKGGASDVMMCTIPINYMVPASSTSATTFKVLLTSLESADSSIYINRSHTDTDSAAFFRGTSQLNVIEILPG